jgi:uncharacterized protein YciI
MSTDHAGSLNKRLAARPTHVARLIALRDEGRLLIAVDSQDPGNAGFTGSLIVVDFPSLDAAKAWADQDPYVAAGVYQNVVVKPFNLVLP